MRQKEKKSLSDKIRYRHRYVGKTFILLILTVFQWTSFLPVVFSGETDGFFSALLLCVYVSFEWMYVTVMHFAMKKTNFELEFIAFFLDLQFTIDLLRREFHIMLSLVIYVIY